MHNPDTLSGKGETSFFALTLTSSVPNPFLRGLFPSADEQPDQKAERG